MKTGLMQRQPLFLNGCIHIKPATIYIAVHWLQCFYIFRTALHYGWVTFHFYKKIF